MTLGKLPPRPAVIATRSSDYITNSGGYGLWLPYDGERADVGDLHSPASRPERLTASVAGFYSVAASICWAANGNGVRFLQLAAAHPNPNGAVGYWYPAEDSTPAATGVRTCQSVHQLVALQAGDYVGIIAAQTSGAALTIPADGVEPLNFSMFWVGPLSG